MVLSPRILVGLLLAPVLASGCDDSAIGTVDGSTPDRGALDSRLNEATTPDRGPGSRDAPLVDATPALDRAQLSPDQGGCTTPTPFVPPGKPSPWKKLTTPLVVLLGAANHRGQDVVVLDGEPQVLIGKFAYGMIDTDLTGEEVEVFLQESPPCGPYVSLGVALTSEDGQYGTQYGVEDDGGRVFFTIPAAHRRPVGRYPVRLLVKGDLTLARFTLVVLPAGTSTVVFDVDGTLTTDDFQLVSQLFAQLLAGSYVPQMRPAADQAVKAWAAQSYLPLYVTGRPDSLRSSTQAWLEQKGFPPGPIHLTDTLAQAVPSSSGVGKYKTEFLQLMATKAKLALYAAYGNAATDLQVYAAAGVPGARTYITGSEGGKQGTTAVVDYPSHLSSLTIPAAAVPAPSAPAGW